MSTLSLTSCAKRIAASAAAPDEIHFRPARNQIKRAPTKVQRLLWETSDQWRLKTVWGVGYKFEVGGPA